MAMAQWHNLSVSRCPWCPAWSSASWTSATSWNLVEYNSSAFASSQLGGWPQKMCHLPTIGDIISTNPPRVQRCCKNPRYIYRARFDVFLSWFLLATPCVFPHYRAHFSSTPMKSKIGTSPKWGTWIGMGILMVYDGIWFLDLSIHFWVRYRDILSLHWDQLIHHRVTARRRRSSQSRYLCPGKNGGPRWEKHEQLGIRTWFLYIYIFHDTMKELFVIFLSDVLCLQDWGSSKLTIIGSHQSLVPLMLVGELTGAAFYQGMSGFNMFHSPFRREEPCHENSWFRGISKRSPWKIMAENTSRTSRTDHGAVGLPSQQGNIDIRLI